MTSLFQTVGAKEEDVETFPAFKMCVFLIGQISINKYRYKKDSIHVIIEAGTRRNRGAMEQVVSLRKEKSKMEPEFCPAASQ